MIRIIKILPKINQICHIKILKLTKIKTKIQMKQIKKYRSVETIKIHHQFKI